MKAFNTIHLFGSGEAQIIGEDLNKKTPNSELTKLAAFVDHIKTFKPEDVVLTDYHVIHIFNKFDVRYLGTSTDNKKDKTTFSVKFDKVDATLLSALIDDIAK